MIKQAILELLWGNADAYISGAELARQLKVSRTAVWKAIEQLRTEGYQIQSTTNKGYRLSSLSDVLSEQGICKYLTADLFQVRTYRTITSTNTVLKGMAEQGAPEGLVLVADQQTEGRGRRDRKFFSPAGTGIYLSALFRPNMDARQATDLTACAAVAVAEAIEELSDLNAQIKWVNDVLVDEKKVCGILTEASVDWESGAVNYVIVGIGINMGFPVDNFPEELRTVAGAVFGAEPIPEMRCRMTAAVLDKLAKYYNHLGDRPCYEAYKKRSLVLGRPINILTPGQNPVPARAIDIDEDFALIVQYEDGTIRRLNSGEVSVRVQR